MFGLPIACPYDAPHEGAVVALRKSPRLEGATWRIRLDGAAYRGTPGAGFAAPDWRRHRDLLFGFVVAGDEPEQHFIKKIGYIYY